MGIRECDGGRLLVLEEGVGNSWGGDRMFKGFPSPVEYDANVTGTIPRSLLDFLCIPFFFGGKGWVRLSPSRDGIEPMYHADGDEGSTPVEELEALSCLKIVLDVCRFPSDPLRRPPGIP